MHQSLLHFDFRREYLSFIFIYIVLVNILLLCLSVLGIYLIPRKYKKNFVGHFMKPDENKSNELNKFECEKRSKIMQILTRPYLVT